MPGHSARQKTILIVLVVVVCGCALSIFITRKTQAAMTWTVSSGNPEACSLADPNCAAIAVAVAAASGGPEVRPPAAGKDTLGLAGDTTNFRSLLNFERPIPDR